MDRVRGVFVPLVLLAVAALMAFLGNDATQHGRMWAAKAQQMGTAEANAHTLAPRAEGEARRRAMLKHAHEDATEGLTLFGCSGLLIAGAALLYITHPRFFRGTATDALMAPPNVTKVS